MNLKQRVKIAALKLLETKECVLYTDLLPLFPDNKPDSVRNSLRGIGLQCFKIKQVGKARINGYRHFKDKEIERLGRLITDNYFPYPDWMMPPNMRENMYQHNYGVKKVKFRSRKNLNV